MRNLDPDEILLDSRNLPGFNTYQLEGRIEQAISKRAILIFTICLTLLGSFYLYRLSVLQIVRGETYRERSEDNSLRAVVLPTERGAIHDSEGKLLAWNDENGGRQYVRSEGSANVIGYLGYPNMNESLALPIQSNELRVGKVGVEKVYDEYLRGSVGIRREEVNSRGQIISENIEKAPLAGKSLALYIDDRLQNKLYQTIRAVAEERGFTGGAGIVMDVNTGGIVAMTSFPEFPLSAASGTTTSALTPYLGDNNSPFLNRAIGGLYTPGSVVKPFVALAALNENIISPDKKILSTGSIKIPNPYNKEVVSIFRDWKAHGLIDMRHALSVSSNVYFYEVGGGFDNQPGLGINRINKYMAMFGFGNETGLDLPGEQQGLVPSPAWKKELFDEQWRLGDTYHTAIGQYGFQVTPLQMVRAVAAIANGGKLLTPQIANISKLPKVELIPIKAQDFQVVREGMRLSALEGTASALNVSYVKFAGKTGTAELGESRQRVNSWVMGFFPYDKPRYAFVVVMERGRVGNIIGAAYVARQFFDWMSENTPEYFISH